MPDFELNTPPQLSPSPYPDGVDQSGFDPGTGEGEAAGSGGSGYLDYPPNLDNSTLPLTLQIAASPPLLDPSLTSIATANGWPVPSPVDRCPPEWKVFYCECRARVAEVGCNNLKCRGCADFLRRRRAIAIEERIEPTRAGRPVIYTIFTVPPAKRKAAGDAKTWGRWLRSLRRVLKRKFGLLYGVERVDPAGDEHPTLWHPHLNVLWVQRDGWRAFIDVDELRAEWARIVDEPVVDIWSQYSTDQARLRHWYSYMGRTWADWRKSVPQHLTIRWIGCYPDRVKDDGDVVCDKCGGNVHELEFRASTREVAEFFCRAGPAACHAEILRRRKMARESKHPAPFHAPWLVAQ